MLASVLQEAGYKTGLYTSPHLTDFRERIRINGEKIPEEYVVDFVDRYTDRFAHIRPSFFEYTFGMAMAYFFDGKVDIAVVETGMGGRLDSTNVILPVLSVITNIGKDHTRFLGETLELIAREKAGIIKEGVPVVIGETQPETEFIFRELAGIKGSDIEFADQVYSVQHIIAAADGLSGLQLDLLKNGIPSLEGLKIPFMASYQLKNTLSVVAASDQLKKQGYSIDESSLRRGILNVSKNTGLAGRWQVLNRNPLTICDTGHNREGIRSVAEQLGRLKYRKLHFVLGTVNDKDLDDILVLLPTGALYYFCMPGIPRGLDPGLLKEKALRFGLQGDSYPSVTAAWAKARQNAKEGDCIFIGGSTFVVAEVLES